MPNNLKMVQDGKI